MFPVRLILLVLAATLICDDSLGSEPNDRRDEILAVMIKMNDKVDVLTGKVNGMEETVGDIKKQVGEVTKEVGGVKKQMDSGMREVKRKIDKKAEKVDSDIISNTGLLAYKFVGRGQVGSRDVDPECFSHCVKMCRIPECFRECMKLCVVSGMHEVVW